MKTIKSYLLVFFVVLGGILFYFFSYQQQDSAESSSDQVQLVDVNTGTPIAPVVRKSDGFDPLKGEAVKPLPSYLKKSLHWLANAQARNGGYGAGQHTNQKNRDPRNVNVDPATTAFVGLALMRVGNTLEEGPYHANLNRALMFVLKNVEGAKEDAPNITKLRGTQPQTKLGQNIDVSLASQFLIRISPMAVDDDALQIRIDEAIAKCLRKLESTQLADGSWNDRGWARVLSSAMANNALEMAEEKGIEFDKKVLALSRKYQQQNVDAKSGRVKTDKAAGISLYAYSSSQRATAVNAKKVQKVMDAQGIKENSS
ncbi:MAG: prenyltransferase/squalene oxidase repeat-containing protein, partial [Bacteroidota bacterium]